MKQAVTVQMMAVGDETFTTVGMPIFFYRVQNIHLGPIIIYDVGLLHPCNLRTSTVAIHDTSTTSENDSQLH